MTKFTIHFKSSQIILLPTCCYRKLIRNQVLVCQRILNIGWILQLSFFSLKNDNYKDIEDINVIYQFAINTAARATHIQLYALTRGIAMRLRARNKKATEDTSNVLFEKMLELIQNISVIICKASPAHNQYVGDCLQCSLFCQKCYTMFGIKGTIFQVLFEAPYAILYHHGLELPDIFQMI